MEFEKLNWEFSYMSFKKLCLYMNLNVLKLVYTVFRENL